ncbi:uncharacterized protein LOC125543430 [Triticum urartu]|uniref:uncharacterized protein LOC125543430 n=1 Tax=Triticum urartu TaxID=4572 RepID=UPI00204310F7|nr:uncharacterized protein LOC125543430 [Triticum urartu]
MRGGRSGGGSGGLRNPCLTMHQSWASLLVHGTKRVEGRSWPSPVIGCPGSTPPPRCPTPTPSPPWRTSTRRSTPSTGSTTSTSHSTTPSPASSDASRWSAASGLLGGCASIKTSLPVHRQGGMPCPGSEEEWSLWQAANHAFELGAPNVIILPGDVAYPDDYNRFVQATIDHYGQWRPRKA